MTSFFGAIALFVLGFLVMIVVLLVIGSRALSNAKKRGVKISDGVSRNEASIVLEEIAVVVEESQLDIKEILELVKTYARQQKRFVEQAKARSKVEMAEKLKMAAEEEAKQAESVIQETSH